MCSEPVGDGAKRTRTVIGSESIDRKLGRMTVTTRRERRERELRRRQREKRGGHPGGDASGGGRGWLVGIGIVVLLVLAVFALRQTGVLSTPQVSPSPAPSPLPTLIPAPPDHPARGTPRT